MALVSCPECNYDKVSTEAKSCPQCNYPMNSSQKANSDKAKDFWKYAKIGFKVASVAMVVCGVDAGILTAALEALSSSDDIA